ncbi:MAG: succinate dehydrogenase [Desulfurococcaceae archaeon]|nr:succinate dehydrogenase [Desulfurococcaceae archaeon]MCC6060540.1 succinate dehydrogenase [Desulfurococcaceae archaeon]
MERGKFRFASNRLGVMASFYPWIIDIKGNPERVAFTLHRLTGVILVGFIALHIVSTNTPARAGWEAWVEEVQRLSGVNLVSILFFIAMGALVFHSLNGIRLLLVELLALGIGRPEKPKPPYIPPSLKGYQRTLIYVVFILSLVIWALMGYVIFLM